MEKSNALRAEWTSGLPTENVKAWLGTHAPTLLHPDRLAIYGDRLRLLHIWQGEQLRAVQVLYATRIHGRPSLSTPPFCPWSGPVMQVNATKAVAARGEEKRLLDAVATALDTQRLPVINAVLGPGTLDVQPFVWKGFELTPKTTYQLDLSVDETSLWEGLDSKRRNQIRKAEQALPTLEQVAVDTLRAYAETHLAAKGALHEPAVFNALFGSEGGGLVGMLAKNDGQANSWYIFQVDGQTIYYLMGGGVPGVQQGEVGSWGMWNCILKFRTEGKTLFDFEGSMLPDVERYFRSFGGEVKTHHAVERLSWVQRLVKRVR